MTTPTQSAAPTGGIDLTGAALPAPPVTDPKADDEVVVGSYDRYEQAQEAVDLLSDKGFPVSAARVVGTGLKLSEQVLGRVTMRTATQAGAMSGAGFGVLLGLILGVTASGGDWAVGFVACVVAGAFWGGITAWFAHKATGGRRDFASVRSLQAERYDLLVTSDVAVRARWLLSQGR